MTRRELGEFIAFAKEQGLMKQRVDLTYAQYMVLRKSWLAGLISKRGHGLRGFVGRD